MEEFKVYPVSCPVEGEVIPLSQVSDTSVASIRPREGRWLLLRGRYLPFLTRSTPSA